MINIMSKKFFRNFLIIGIFGLTLFLANFCLAAPLELKWPSDGATDVSKGCTVPLGKPADWDDPDDPDEIPEGQECYFRWQEVEGAAKYVLDIDQFTQSEDNILPADFCLGEICSFGFLNLTVGTITYLTPYCWNITAYDAKGDNIAASEVWCFTTEPAPKPSCPYECSAEAECGSRGGECVDGNYAPCPSDTPCCCKIEDGGGDGIPILINPLKAKTLEEAINALINFLFFLAMAIAPILIIYAAFLLLTAHGDPKQISKAKTIIFWTVIALAIVLLAKGLPSVIKGVLGG